MLVGQRRLFSVSTRLSSPVAAKATTARKSATKTPVKKKRTTVKKKKTAVTATKRKTSGAKKTKKAAPKKRKVAAPKKRTRVTVRRRKITKVVPKKVTPRTDASLRPPPRSISSFSLFVKRMWPTISPRPANVVEGLSHVRTMWHALTVAEKQPFIDEASVLSEQRSQDYDKWRAGLSRTQVIAINASRKGTKHAKLGPPASAGAPKEPVKGFLKFFSVALKNGTIDPKNAPAGARPIVYATKEAGRLWRSMTAEQKQPYL